MAANWHSTSCRKNPSHTLSPPAPSPAWLKPSFQSPLPISGSPLGPMRCSVKAMARRQCSSSDAVSRDGRGTKLMPSAPARDRAALQERHRVVQNAAITRLGHVAADQIGEPEVRVRGAIAGAETGPAAVGAGCHHCSTSPSTNCWRACSRICRRARSGCTMSNGSTSCSWSRKPKAPPRWLGPQPAPQAGGQQLVGQPVIDQPVEFRPIGLDPQIAQG